MKTIPTIFGHCRGLFWALCLTLGTPLLAVSTDAWIDPSYPYRIAITNLSPVNPSAAGSLIDFPVLIAITNATWLRPYLANGGDITFGGVDGQQLFHEVEYFGQGSGLATLQAWVCLPSFTNNTTVYLYWGNNSGTLPFNGSNATTSLISSFSDLRTGAISTNVWDTNYLCVLHFNESATANYILAKDSSRFQMNTATASGSNILTNQVGIGVGTLSNSMNARLGLGSTNIKISSYGGKAADYVRGIYIDKFNNSPGLAAYDLINNSASGQFTMSVWAKWLSAPSNQATWSVGAATNWANFTNLTSITIMGLKDSGQNLRDGRSHYFLFSRASNNFGRTLAKNIGSSGTQNLAVTNISNFGMANAYSNWYRYVATVGTIGTSFYLTNWVNDAMVYNASGAPITGTVTPGGLYLAGGDGGDYPQGGDHLFTPNMLFDEYRVSYGVRSANWLTNEYRNVVNTTNMANDNGLVNAEVEALFKADITNYNTFPSPVTDGWARLGIGPSGLVAPTRPPNYVTNIAFTLDDLTGGTNLVVTNLFFAGETNDYSFIFSNLPAGQIKVTGTMNDSLSNTALLKPYTFPVGPVPFYDLSKFSIYSSNAGFILDLFQGLDGGTAAPTSVVITRDSANMAGYLQNLGSSKYIDTNDLFYDEGHIYQAVIQYSNLVYYTNALIVVPGRRTTTSPVGPAGGVVENFEFKVTVPPGGVSAAKNLSISFPSDVVGIDGYRQMVVDDGDGVFSFFAQPISLRLKVRVSGGSITVPGTTKRLVLNDANKLRMGYWDGFQWNPLPTSLVAYSNRLELSSAVTREGRFALLFNDGSSGTVESFRIRNRVLVPGSSDPTYGTVYFGWDKGASDKASLSILTTTGKLVYQRKDMPDPFWIWDGKGTDGSDVSPGLYLYQVQIGTTKTYRGTLAIMAK